MACWHHCLGSRSGSNPSAAHGCGLELPQPWDQVSTAVGRCLGQAQADSEPVLQATGSFPLSGLRWSAEPLGSCIAPMPWFTRGSVIGIALALIVQLLAPTPLRAVLAGTDHLVEAKEIFTIQLWRSKEAPQRETHSK